MSRSRNSQDKSAAAAVVAAAPPPKPQEASPLPPTPVRRTVLWLAAGLAVAWTIWLAGMGWTTANPALISGAQIDRADAVVIAKVIEPAHNRLRVDRVLSGRLAAEDEITLLNFADVRNADGDGPFLIPLTQFREDYVVTTIEGQRTPPLVYPATPAIIERAKELVRAKTK